MGCAEFFNWFNRLFERATEATSTGRVASSEGSNGAGAVVVCGALGSSLAAGSIQLSADEDQGYPTSACSFQCCVTGRTSEAARQVERILADTGVQYTPA